MNKRNLLSSLCCLLALSSESFAFQPSGSFDVGVTPGKVTSGSSGASAKPVSGSASGNISTSCTHVESAKKEHLSLSLIRGLMINKAAFKVEKIDATTHRVLMPNMVSAGCLKDRLEVETVAVGNGIGLAFKLKSDGVDEKAGYAQLKRCFQDAKIMEGDKFKRERVKSEHLADFAFNINVEELDDNSVQTKELFFISPDRDPAKLHPEILNITSKIRDEKFNKCYSVETHKEGGYAVYKNTSITEAYSACSSNNLKKMLAAYKDLKVAGNAAGAFKLALKALEIAMQDQLDENKKRIFKKLRKYKTGKLRDANKDMRNGKLEADEAERVVKGYAEILNELDREVLNPAIREIESLLAEREEANEGRQDEIDKRVKSLNKIIGEFAKGKTKYGADTARAIAKKFALINEGAKDIIGFTLKSRNWARVGEGRRQISAEKAKKNIKKGLRKFGKVAANWEREYEDFDDANNGDYGPSRDAGRKASRYRRSKDSGYKRYQDKEKKYASYCKQGFFGVKNPVRCQRNMSPQAISKRRNRYLKQRASTVRKEDYYQGRQSYYSGLANDSRRRDREEDDYFSDDYGFSDYNNDPYLSDYNPYGNDGNSSYNSNNSYGSVPLYGQYGQYGQGQTQAQNGYNNGRYPAQGQYNGGSMFNIGGAPQAGYPQQQQFQQNYGAPQGGYPQQQQFSPYGATQPQYPMMR